ncbi:MAG: amidohydrolase, partial [Myxococcota bacterium]
PTGTVGSRAGTLLAATASMHITIRGKGGHAALPHTCIDPVTTTAKLILELQTIVARELDPMDSGIVSVTEVHGGTAFNVIPGEMELKGTLRALTLEGMAYLKQRVTTMAEHIAAANRCQVTIDFPGASYPPTVNDPACWDMARHEAAALLNPDNVLDVPAVMGGEDFAYYTEQVPGCFMLLGTGNPDKGTTHSVHHPAFKVDEDALPTGTTLHVLNALRALDDLST